MYQQQPYQPGQTIQGQVVQGQPMQGFDQSGMDEFKDPIGPHVPPYVRNNFIVKVYSILSVQLTITFAIALFIRMALLDCNCVHQYMWVYYLCSFGTLAVMLGVSCCCSGVARTFPTNYIFLLVITVGISVMVGFATLFYSTDSVLLALATTCGIFFALTAFACLTKSDFTGMGPYLFGALAALMMFGFTLFIFNYFFGVGQWMYKIYAGIGVLIFTLYIVYDTQLIVGGAHKKHQFSIDDYAFAALNLYLDIINLFLFLLELMGDRR